MDNDTEYPTDNQVHVDVTFNILGTTYFAGHANVTLDEDSVPMASQMADLLHQIAWGLEEPHEMEDKADAPVEPSPEPKPQRRVFRDDKMGKWYEVRPNGFTYGKDWASAEESYEQHGERAITSLATLKNVYRVLTLVEE